MHIKVKELHKQERPREKALLYGVERLGNRDLIAILLRSGCQGVSVLQLADEVLASYGLCGLKEVRIEDLMCIKGISQVKALQIIVALELAKRILEAQVHEYLRVDSPQVIAEYLMKKYGSKKQEHFIVLYLDTKLQLIEEKVLFIGSLNQSVIHTREIFKEAMACSCASIMVAHNHPTNQCIPSEQDVLATDTIKKTADLVGIPLIDHLIVGEDRFFSFKESMLLL